MGRRCDRPPPSVNVDSSSSTQVKDRVTHLFPHGKVERKERSILDCSVFRAVDQRNKFDGVNSEAGKGRGRRSQAASCCCFFPAWCEDILVSTVFPVGLRLWLLADC